jgi:hypothetical protein
MMFFTNAKIFELCSFCGKKCSKVIMEKLIVMRSQAFGQTQM